MRIGPEPTTDKFICIMHGNDDRVIPGNALALDPNKPFMHLGKFGNAFLNRFQCSTMDSSVLKGVTLIDTPGILSGGRQRVDRGYDLHQVLEWFSERVDRIILLFDAHKLDISDEFRGYLERLNGQHDKIRIVLNKADMVDTQALMRVHGALMWNLGKILHTPEVERVFIASFWNQPLTHDDNKKLFEKEEQDLISDLQTLPRDAALRKLNDLIKRARLAKVHAYIIAELKNEMPSVFGKENKKNELIKNLSQIYKKIQTEQEIPPGDFPEIERMKEQLKEQDFTKFKSIKPQLLETVNKMLTKDIAKLMDMLPAHDAAIFDMEGTTVKGGAFDSVNNDESVFGHGKGEGVDEGAGEPEWIVTKDRDNYDQIFENLNPVNGKITRSSAKLEMDKSKLPNTVLGKIWKLADIDTDGLLDSDEFALLKHLIKIKLDDHALPSELPEHLIPPSKRAQ